ncbi:MAG: asparaginase, partial [Myxococcales bacterium]|nr:asparaginase [Myxococcales bacterium]
MAPPADPIAVRVWRGDLVESEHRAVASVWRGDTRIGSIGDVERRHFPRSAAKPFQALASLTILDAEGFALRDEERAVIASSHAGEPLHTELITGLLARAGLDGTHLRCGAHAPFAEEAARALVRSRAAPTALHHNCSGKHAAMLAT